MKEVKQDPETTAKTLQDGGGKMFFWDFGGQRNVKNEGI